MRGEFSPPAPILCVHLLRTVDERLIDLLSLLTSDEWDLQTIVPLWKVRDVSVPALRASNPFNPRNPRLLCGFQQNVNRAPRCANVSDSHARRIQPSCPNPLRSSVAHSGRKIDRSAEFTHIR